MWQLMLVLVWIVLGGHDFLIVGVVDGLDVVGVVVSVVDDVVVVAGGGVVVNVVVVCVRCCG